MSSNDPTAPGPGSASEADEMSVRDHVVAWLEVAAELDPDEIDGDITDPTD